MEMNLQGKLKRMEYFLYSIIATAATAVLAVLAVMAFMDGISNPISGIIALMLILATLVPIVANWLIATKRTRDTGLNPWWVLLLIVPYVNIAFSIVLLFAPSDSFNKN